MQAIILAAGEGTRMRPLTETVPKPMLPVADRPLVAHTADALISAGVDELVFVIGYGADAVREFFGDEYRGVPVSYAVQERQLGTAHAVQTAREHIETDFAVVNGDDLYDPTGIGSLLETCPSVGAYRVDNPRPYGVLELDGETVTGIVEKPDSPPSQQVNIGAYHFPAEARDWLDVPPSDRGEHEITDVLATVIDRHRQGVRAVTVDRWMGVGRPWELLEANEWKLGDLEPTVRGEVHDDAELRGPVSVEEDATIEAGAVIEGPVLVRASADVGPNAYVRGATLLDTGVHVGHGVEVKNSVVMRGTNIPHLSYIGDSVLGPRVNLGAGTQVANLRHDGADVRVSVKGERISTGRRKFGIVAGPDAKTAINTSLNAGVTLSAGATTAPGEAVTRDR